MSNNTPTDRATLLNEAVDLISSTTVSGVLYTFSFVLYCLSTRLFYLQHRDVDGKLNYHTVFTYASTSIMIVCATIDVTTLNLSIQTIFVDSSTLPGGPEGALAEKRALATLQVNFLNRFVETTLSLGILFWRVWTVWSGTCLVKPITIFFLLLYLATTGTHVWHIVIDWYSESPDLLDTPQFLASMALVAASTIFMASMIIIRLMVARWQHIKIMGKTETATQYLGITAMLVESFSLAAAWVLALSICPVIENAFPALNFFNDSAAQIEALTYFLVIYRVFSGRAWDRQTQSRLSTLRWEHSATQSADTTIGTVSIGRVNVQDSNLEENTHV